MRELGQVDYKLAERTKLSVQGGWNFYDLLFTDRVITVTPGNRPALSTTSTVTYKYTAGSPAGTLPTGSSQCTFVYSTTNYKTPNNQAFPLTPTINGSNFPSSTGNTATVTVTADRKLTFTKRATTSIVGGAVTKVGQGSQFNYVLHIDCPGDGAIPGAIGTQSLTLTDQLPANFTYQSYVEIYNANNGNFAVSPPVIAFPGTVTTPNAGNNNTFTYSDPSGDTCTGKNSNAPGRDIQITGTASTAGRSAGSARWAAPLIG